MALDPEIAMGYRFPQVQVNIPQPLQQLGQVLTLRNLMTQGQMSQLQLQQAQEEWRQRQALSKLLFEPQTNAPQAGTVESSALPVAPAGPAIPLAPQPDMFARVGTPANTSDMFARAGATYGGTPLTDTLPPVYPALTAPAPAPAISPAPAIATPVTPAAPAAMRPTGQIQTPGQINIPDFRKWFQVAPLIAPQMADTYLKSIKSAYDVHNAAFTNQQNVLKRAAGLANTIVDEPTKMTAIATAEREGIVSPQERDRLMQVKFDDPIWKSWQQGALTGAEGLENQRAELRLHMEQVTKALELAKAPYELASARSGAIKAGTEADVATRNEDASRLIAAAAQGPEQLKKAYDALPTQRQAPFAGANTSEEIYYRLHPEQRPGVAAARAGAEDLARKTAQAQYYAPTTASVLSGKTRLQDVDPEIQKIIMPALIEGGYGQSGTPTATAGAGFGKLISDAERERLGDYDRATTVLQNTLGKVTDPENIARMGPFAGQLARNPYATNYGNLQSDLIAQQQQLKKFATNGLLRGVTPDMIDKLFPTITTHPDKAKHQIENWLNLAQAEKQQYLRDLADKVIPPALKGPPAAPPTAPQPPYQTIERTGTPGPRVTGSFTIGQGPGTAPAVTPPNRIAVTGPDGKGYWLRADQWPDAQRQGYTRQ